MRRHRGLTTAAVMTATVMQALDTTIVNVALPQMQGQFGATADQISWVLTSYLVSSGVFMLLTGFLTDRIGQRRYLLLSIGGFTLASMLCGLAASLEQMVLFRLLQGVFGAALVPLSQSIMVQVFPAEERGRAMALWGMGVMVGPILGPTLGGWLTEVLDWRWTFFVNLPVGLLSALLAWQVVADSERRHRPMDGWGLAYLAIAIGGLQYLLDRGSSFGWLDAGEGRLAAALALFGLAAFIWHALRGSDHPIVNLAIFRDRNFTMASVLLAVFGLGLFGNMLILPMMLGGLFDYPATTVGLVLAPRGLASMFSMLLVGRLMRRYDPRLMVAAGAAIFTYGSWLTTHYSLAVTSLDVVIPSLYQGLGLGLVFVPLSTVAYATLPPQLAAEAAGIYSLMRTLGASVGIAIVAGIMADHAQIGWNSLGGAITLANPAASHYLAPLGLDPQSAQGAAIIAQELARQSRMLGMLDAYTFVTYSFACMLPLVALLRYRRPGVARAA